MRELSRSEKSLLLYLETCAVDQDGRINRGKINDEERRELDVLVRDGLIHYGRVNFRACKDGSPLWVQLTDLGWEIAHKLRRARAERIRPGREGNDELYVELHLAKEGAMSPKWADKSWRIHERFLRFSQKRGELLTEPERLRFLSLAICGEAGELANLFKKSWRGDKVDLADIRSEMADVRIYLNHLAVHLGIDLDEACQEKLEIVAARIAEKEAEDAQSRVI